MIKNFIAKQLILVIILSFWSNGLAQTKAVANKPAAKGKSISFGNVEDITAARMKEYLKFIASDELEGRDTPSRGLDIAAMFIASHLANWGVKPAGDGGSYFQKFPLKRNKIDALATKLQLNGQTYHYGDDFLSQYFGKAAEGKVVFGGNGWVVKSKNINPYQGVDVRNKIIVITNSFPKGVTFSGLTGKEGVDWFDPITYAKANGAKAIVVFPGFNTLASWQLTRQRQTENGDVFKAENSDPHLIPIITVSPKLVAALFRGEKESGASILSRAWAGETIDGFELKSEKKMDLTVALKTEAVSTQNVIGIIEGSDPILKNEYVAVGAHYDHVGIGNSAGVDRIYNGADDDGSGTVAVMAIAEALSKGQRPKRSVLFIWHAAEEKGLWGSEYFTDHPTVPIGSIITQLNIDMIGRAQKPGDENHPVNKEMAKPNEVFVVGSKLMSSELGLLSETVNKSFLNMSFNYKFDAPDDPERIFYRSDHYNYARKGIPIIFYTDGSHVDYHQPSDSVETIDFAQMERVTRTIFATTWELANRTLRPKVEKPLPN